MDGWTDDWRPGRMIGGLEGWMDRRMIGGLEGWMDGRMIGGLDGWMDGRMIGGLDGWMELGAVLLEKSLYLQVVHVNTACLLSLLLCQGPTEGLKSSGGQKQTDTRTTSDGNQFSSFLFWRDPLLTFNDELLGLLKEGNESPQTEKRAEQRALGGQSDNEDKENEPDDEDDEENDDDDDDGGGWITPGNIKQVKMDSADWTAPADIRVGCLTTDFAMQNVLIQIGLHVLSVNGMLIKQARNYILRCHACFKTTSDMNRAFCPHCGNRTLKKLAVTVNEDGSMQMHFSKNPKVLNPRGLRHTLPLPQGGKHSTNPHLVEDQRFPQQRLSQKARQKTDVFNPDYVAGTSPFCENDIYSRAANLQIRDSQCGGGRRRANPNATRRKFVKKK